MRKTKITMPHWSYVCIFEKHGEDWTFTMMKWWKYMLPFLRRQEYNKQMTREEVAMLEEHTIHHKYKGSWYIWLSIVALFFIVLYVMPTKFSIHDRSPTNVEYIRYSIGEAWFLFFIASLYHDISRHSNILIKSLRGGI